MWWFNRFALWRAGARGRRLRAGMPLSLERFDGFVIGGGDDIDATLYGGTLQPMIRIDKERDALELNLLKHAVRRNLPVLGICRGAQMINVFLGGVLHGSIYKAYPGVPRLHSPLPSKDIVVERHSRLFELLRSEHERVNALHHQSINLLGVGLDVVARDQYGIIQAIEHPGYRFLLGVQWHPEFMVFSRGHQRLFRGLVDAAQRWRQSGFRSGQAAELPDDARQRQSEPSDLALRSRTDEAE